jgi:small-conductance mechanosensitive channel
MKLIALVLVAALALGLGGGARAQPPASAASAQPALTAEQAQRALEVLRDPQRRNEVISVLEALSKARVATPAMAAPAPAPAPAATARPARAQPGPAAPVESGSGDEAPASAARPGAAAAAAPGTPAPAAPVAGAPAPVEAAPATPPAAARVEALPLAPDSVGAQVIVGVSDRLARLSSDVVQAARAVISLPLLGLWVVQFATDPDRQELLLDTVWRLALVLAVGLLLEWLVARLLRPLQGRIAARVPAAPMAPVPVEAVDKDATTIEREARQSARLWQRVRRLGTWLRRVPFGVASFVLDLLPVVAVLAAASGLIAAGLGEQQTPRLVILAGANAYAVYRTIVALARMLVQPDDARLRLVPVSDTRAAYVLRWARRAAAVGIFGYATVEAGLLFGLYRLAHDALVKVVLLMLAGIAVTMILQNRAVVADRIRPPEDASGPRARMRALLAPVWHVAAVFYVLALWVVVALEVRDGFSRLMWLSVVTALVLVLSRVVNILALGALHKLVAQADDAGGAAGRVGAYQPFLRAFVRLLLGAATIVVLLEAWGMPVVGWFLSANLGGRLLGTMASIGFTVLLAVAVWEAVNAAIARYLAGLAGSAQAVRSARLRTLLPMFRTALLVAICIVSALIVLSEIGLNIAPLLAGAGVVGVAIGLGAQRLVQDIITGLFLLLENTMQVGDVVTLGGLSGTVENLSIRTIRLRAQDGSIHIIPFSAVTTITNMTRDFGYAVVDVSVGLNENTDKVSDILRHVAAGLRQETKWAGGISGDLEVLGIDRFIENAVVLRTRIRTTPAQRWAVARELNRRIKQRFDELAVESPMTSHRVLSTHTFEEASG